MELGFGFWMTAFALAIGLWHGGTVSLLQVDLAFRYDGETLVVQVDPVFIVRGDDLRKPCGAQIMAAAFGNVIFWADWWPDVLYEPPPDGYAPPLLPPLGVLRDQIMVHEYLHVCQYRAVGLLFCVVQFGVEWEGAPGTYSLQTMDALNHTMWAAPRGWPDLGYALTLRLGGPRTTRHSP